MNHEDRLQPILNRIPPGWGSWIDIYPGWYDIVVQLDKDIATLHPDYEVHQVKEKFGGLRYYCSVDGNEAVGALIQWAEAVASRTCEYCGGLGKMCNQKGWWKTLCEQCEAGKGQDS